MMRVMRYIDKLSEWTGTFCIWLIIPLMVVVCYEVGMRHFFNAPTSWGYDTCWMLYSLQFMIGGAYTLLHKYHVRIDIVYNVFSPRGKLIFDIVIYAVVIMFPLALLTWGGVEFAADSWTFGENLSTTNWLFPSGPIKTVIPIAFVLLGLQALSEIIRNIITLTKEEKE